MQSQGYPHCCTSTIITGMGSSRNSSAYTGDRMSAGDKFDRLVGMMNNERMAGRAMLQCVITQDQQQAMEAMRALGWRFGPWAKSRNHQSTRTRLCYWLVQDGMDFATNIEKAKEKYLEKVKRNNLK